MKFAPGTRIGSYEIIALLGQGGMGEVYKAHDVRLGRFVAIKVLPASLAGDRQFRERFDREARAIAALTHPHIVTIHSIEEHAGAPFLTMELVEGRTLDEMIPPGGLPLREFFDLAIPLADAVAAAHQRGVTHRDLKPGNIMVTADGRVKVLDFGLAKLTEATPAGAVMWSRTRELLTDEGHIIGTIAYMSPEQAEGKPVDSRSDIFSLGIIYYEMATGQRPFTGDSNTSLLSSILRDQPQAVTDLNGAVPAGLGRLIRRCLEKAPNRRVQSAFDLRNELEELRTDVNSAVSPRPVFQPETTLPLPVARPRSRRRMLLVAGAVAGIAVAGAAYLAWRSRAAPLQPPPAVGAESARSALPATSNPVVAVSRFENRTGDASLDPVGQMAADTIAQQLPQLEFAGRVAVGPSDLHGARKRAVVTGAYYLDGQNLRIQAWLSDPSGALIYAVAPVTGPRADPGQSVRLAQQRVLGALVTLLDPSYLPGPLTRPMLFDAYREYQAGLELYGTDTAGALPHLERAVQLDPDYVAAALQIAAIRGDMGDRVRQKETLARLASMRDRLSRMERLLLDYMVEWSEERPLDALKTLRQAEQLQPDNMMVNYLVGVYSVRVNRPQEAIDELGRIKAEQWNGVTAGAWRYGVLTGAHHLLGRHDEELRIARSAEAVFPSSVTTRGQEMNALAALGQIDDLRRAVNETLTLNVTPRATPGGVIRDGAEELRAHGHRMEAIDFALIAVRWYRTRSLDVQQRESSRYELARALYVAERWPEAAGMASALVKQQRGSSAYLGLAGAVAARRGDRKAARKASDQLARMPSDDGQVPLLRARIASVLGDREQALGLLRDAVAKGVPFGTALHRSMDFESLRGWPPFDDFMRPRDLN